MEILGRAGEFESEPLSGRALALQERVLAKRDLHYNIRQMYFECNEGISGEDGCHFEDRLCILYSDKASMLGDADRETLNYLLLTYDDRKVGQINR